MRVISLLVLGIVGLCTSANCEEFVYRGKWNTTNHKLDGDMNCVVERNKVNSWNGRFWGVWQGVAFDYKVAFTGSPDDLEGSANIDGATYQWRGVITSKTFTGNFTGDRYSGSFDLERAYKSAAGP